VREVALELEQHLCRASGQDGVVVVHALCRFDEGVEERLLLQHGPVREDRGDAAGGVDDPDHRLPRNAFEEEAGRRVRGHQGVPDGVAAVDLVGDGRGHDEEVVDRIVAGGGGRSVDDAAHLLEPAGLLKLLRGAVPIASEDPRAD